VTIVHYIFLRPVTAAGWALGLARGALLGDPRRMHPVAGRHAGQHPSPIEGWRESAFAVGAWLGGLNRYGERVERGLNLSDGRPVELSDVPAASRLAAWVSIAAGMAAAVLAGVRR
jgi:cobalamin biosynthesis protein CobD/CbiB